MSLLHAVLKGVLAINEKRATETRRLKILRGYNEASDFVYDYLMPYRTAIRQRYGTTLDDFLDEWDVQGGPTSQREYTTLI